MRRSVLALVVVVGLTAGAACGPDGDDDPDTTVPTAPATSASTTTATTEPDIAKIPEVIDAPYLNRVLAALDSVDTTAVRIIQETKRVPPQVAEIFNSIYSDDWFSIKIDSWVSQLQKDPDLSGLKNPLGDRHTTVERLITVSPQCVWLAVRRDYSDSNAEPTPPQTEYLALQPLDSSNDPKHHNSTAWMITTDGYRKDGTEPSNPCPGG